MNRTKCYEKDRVQTKDYNKNPRESKEELLNEKYLATSRTKTHDRREQTAQVPGEKRERRTCVESKLQKKPGDSGNRFSGN